MKMCLISSMVWYFSLTSCKSEKESSKNLQESVQSNFCDDFSELSPEELKVREGFGYVAESPIEENQCNNCKLWIPQETSEKCGSCMLFKGPVYAVGYCTYWAPQD